MHRLLEDSGPVRSARGVMTPRRLEARGRQLARDHETRAGLDTPLQPPTERLRAASRALLRAYRELGESALGRGDLPPGSAWILDNFHLARDQLRDTLLGLNRAHYRPLPRLPDGPFPGAPRVYEIVHELVRALDHQVGESDLTTFLRAYQDVSPLDLGELWATPAALRVVLLQRLAELATDEVEAHRERGDAVGWARRIAAASSVDPAEAVLEAGRMFSERDRLSDSFVTELAERLRGRGTPVRPVLDWIERRLERRDLTIETIVRQETQRHVSISNAFTSLRWAGSARWGAWVERVSMMEEILRLDPLHVYPAMDFATRDMYRRRVETLSRGCGLTEREVAERVTALAREALDAASDSNDPAVGHVGFHLIGPGREALEALLGYSAAGLEVIRSLIRRHPGRAFFGLIAVGSVALLGLLLGLTASYGASTGVLWLMAALSILPALEFAVTTTNRAFAFLLPPAHLPKLSRKRGLRDDERTLVVVPTLITSPDRARERAEALEVLAFANPEPNLRFALLTDFADAPRKDMPGDDETVAAAIEAIRGLNERHADRWGDRFFLLHRERRWSETERCWMGWERKRGKIEELNSLLRTPLEPTSFTTIEGDFFGVTADDRIRFVITLDSDTRMPPRAAIDLVRTAAHPLNRARYDARLRRVTRGYGIIQPRVAAEASRRPRTRFAGIMSGSVGVDPYSHAVSDTYQDLFGEGIYTGKGLYDVDAFVQALGGVIPAGAVLSHDLLESAFVRAGLATDVAFFDEFPSHYIPWARRLHRWVRGDWQILPWLGRTIRIAGGERIRNPIRGIARWQIVDNIRRSATPFGLVAFLIAAWIAVPQAAGWWTAVILAVLGLPVLLNVTSAAFQRSPHLTWRGRVDVIGSELAESSLQMAVALTLLAHQAAYHLDAAARATHRLVTRRRLLEWITAREVEDCAAATPGAYVGFVWPSGAIGLGTAVLAGVFAPAALPFVLPFAVIWISAPWLMWWLSQPRVKEVRSLTGEELAHLRDLGRRTWAYFEEYWGPEHSWLPPDNVQLDPPRGVAARTSPTNIGLALVAAQVARDFGWLTRGQFVDRVERAIEAIRALDRHRGHLYNWYDTRTGERMWPPYVSTADSGNLAASLLVVASGLDEVARSAAPDPMFFEGLADTVRTAASTDEDGALRVTSRVVLDEIASLRPGLDSRTEWSDALERLEPLAARLRAGVNGTASAHFAAAAGLAIQAQLAELDADPTSASARARRLAADCRRLFDEMDFEFLFEPRRGLLAVGYNVETRRQDECVYDLLASEARLASLVATAKGDVPAEHWFRLGRPVIDVGRRATLLSWGGTMFEYLMPLLFTPAFKPTLLADSYTGAVDWQRRHGARHGRPWGASESQYAAVNADLDYRYRAFGVPGLGLRRGLAEDYVVAPYASALALMVDPRAAFENLSSLERMGAVGTYGFFEAVDFTRARVPAGRGRVVVPTFMAHHAGMTLGAMCNALQDNRIQDLFLRSRRMRSTELLLQERVPPRVVRPVPHPLETDVAPADTAPVGETVDHVFPGDRRHRAARGQFLSNGRLRTFFHENGSGAVSFETDALIRSNPTDPRFPLGLFLYIRDLDSGRVWSATREPVRGTPDRLEAWFHLNKVELARVEDWIETFLEIVVSPEDDVDVRRLTITNYSDRPRRLDVTSYAELVIDDARADRAHPAYSKLFVRTVRSPEHDALLATRQFRDPARERLWLVHTLGCDRARLPDPTAYETDRSRFIGRGRGLGDPQALDADAALSGTDGLVLDPIVSLRKPFTLGPGDKVQIAFCLGAGRDRAAAERLADLYDNPAAVDRAIGLATTSATLERQRLSIEGERIQAYQQLGSVIHTANPVLRAPPEILQRRRGTQADLWRHGISGDLPIVVARIVTLSQLDVAEWLQGAFTYWRRKGLDLDLVFLNEHGPSYADELQHALERLTELPDGERGSAGGGIHVVRDDLISEDERTLLLAVARAVVEHATPDFPLGPGERRRGSPPDPTAPQAIPAAEASSQSREPAGPAPTELSSFNGFGGFDLDAHEYVIRPVAGEPSRPPAPWVNVIANPRFGTLVTDAGSSTTWSINSQQRRLSPWSNDPVCDPTGEALLIRDDDAGVFWSPWGGPAAATPDIEVRHGMGYSVFRSASGDVGQEVTVHVDSEDPVKVVRLELENLTGRSRRLSAFFYLEWVLGVSRTDTAPHIVTTIDPRSRLVLARNSFDDEFSGRVAWVGAGVGGLDFEATCDRASFLGAGYDPGDPVSIRHRQPLDGRDGPGIDPCAALRVTAELEPRGRMVLRFFVGDASSEADARGLAERIRAPGAADRSLEHVRSSWSAMRETIVVRTPAPELDALLNGWLLYQTLSCRMWGRTAFYQSGGAFGFRDQLQDAMALVYSRPSLTREQIILHAAHQFVEGDVLHWWHPPGRRGTRTRISDDLLWLPHVVTFYVESTGDRSVLDEIVPYVEARPLEDDESEAYVDPRLSAETGDVYDHCCRSIDLSLRVGAHGLPLIGTGDWNDGMNRVGKNGRGESVWLGFFLVAVIDGFLPFVRERGDHGRLTRYRVARDSLAKALEETAWDGEWYRRGYFDDGTPLGSARNVECRIDLIAQAWSVISGLASDERRDAALASVERLLVDPEERLIKLLAPPFERGEPDPGYIASYPPGVRENGGQYTHGALWAVQAFAEAGHGDRAVELLRMTAPPNHTRSPDEVRRFRNEPYVASADVYSAAPHTGRGGWSWYTGSAAWMYRVALESILGLRLERGTAVRFSPCVAADWPEFRIRYSSPDGRVRYEFRIENPDGAQTGIAEVEIDGDLRPVGARSVRIDLSADGALHRVRIRMGAGQPGSEPPQSTR